MPTVSIPFAGGSYRSLSLPYMAANTKNMFFEVRQGGRSVAALHGTPGLRLFASTAAGPDRGMCVHNGILYKVTGNTLYSISSGGVSTSIGTITGTNQCGMVSDGNYLVITTGGDAYTYNGTLAAISDTDLETPNTVAYNNSRVIYDGDDGRFCVADVGQPSVIDGLNYATAEALPGECLAVFAHKQYVIIFCDDHYEPWYNSGVGSPPYDRVNGAVQNVGLGAIHSIAQNENYLYFLDERLMPRRIYGISQQPIGNTSLSNEFADYSTASDAKGFCFTWRNENFYVLTFPTANKSWMYQESINEWLQLSSGQSDGRWRGNSFATCYGHSLVADYETGEVFYLDQEYYTDNGELISRERATQPLHGGIISGSYEGKTVFMSRLELVLEAGIGLATGQGVTPQMMLQWSDDGGFTWSNELWQSAGVMGARYWRVQWFNLGSFTSRIYRFRATDPVKWSWLACNADIEVGI